MKRNNGGMPTIRISLVRTHGGLPIGIVRDCKAETTTDTDWITAVIVLSRTGELLVIFAN